ncbi:MAG: nitroreductase family protein [Flavitalea sp.]
MEYDIDAFNHLIKNRRSVYPNQFDTARQIPDAIIEQILKNATWAPNHSQTEPWHFTVYSGEGLNALALFQSELYKSESGEKFKEEKFLKLQEQPLLASHVISIGMKRSTEKRIPEIEEIAAVACAVQNIYLSTTVYGLGGYWTTGGITYFPNAKSFFGLGKEDKLMGFFYLGYIAIPSPPSARKSIDEKVTWVQ